jgi:hypothetical protein
MASEADINFLTSDLYHDIFDSIGWGVLSFSACIFLAFIIAVIKNSPKEMQIYKWYILVNHTLLFIIEIIMGMIHPKYLFPIFGYFTGMNCAPVHKCDKRLVKFFTRGILPPALVGRKILHF